jgi:hypothetical protein
MAASDARPPASGGLGRFALALTALAGLIYEMQAHATVLPCKGPRRSRARLKFLLFWWSHQIRAIATSLCWSNNEIIGSLGVIFLVTQSKLRVRLGRHL